MKQIRWLGHAGFKISFSDPKNASIIRNVYIDTWLGNPLLPEDVKAAVPDDADLIMATHGHFDHSGSCPDLLKNSKKEGAKIICNYEIAQYFTKTHGVPEGAICGMNKGGTLDFGFCTVTMVSADHSSGCLADHGLVVGGEAAGFVITAHDFAIYHAGDTNVFGDMSIISELYAPTHVLIPIGGHFTMGPNEAAYAVAKFLLSAKIVIPMHFGTFPLLKGTVEEFNKCLEKWSDEYKREPVKVINPHTLIAALTDLPHL